VSFSRLSGVELSLLFDVLEVGERVVDGRREIVTGCAEMMGSRLSDPGRIKDAILSALAKARRKVTRVRGPFGSSRISPDLSNLTAPHDAAVQLASEPL
jgi:hypothetical protein